MWKRAFTESGRPKSCADRVASSEGVDRAEARPARWAQVARSRDVRVAPRRRILVRRSRNRAPMRVHMQISKKMLWVFAVR